MIANASILVLVLALGDPATGILRWRNGDVLSGTLMESRADRIRWSGPHWDQPWELAPEALDSIRFLAPSEAPGGAFRIRTATRDILLADPAGADPEAFVLESFLLGSVRIRRDAIRSMERVVGSGKILLAVRYRDWIPPSPVRKLRYRTYHLDPRWEEEELPDLSGMAPLAEGDLPDGRIDFGVTSWDAPRAIVFEGEIRVRPDGGDLAMSLALAGPGRPTNPPGSYSRFTVGNRVLVLDRRKETCLADRRLSPLGLEPGWHPLRFVHAGSGRGALVGAAFGPARGVPGTYGPVMAPVEDPLPGWRKGVNGHPTTSKRATVLREVEHLPGSFEMELDLISGRRPRFGLELGEPARDAGSPGAFGVRTRGDLLVVSQGDAFRPVRKLEEADRTVRLRLLHDGEQRRLMVLDWNGEVLTDWRDMRIGTGASVVRIVNHGADLTVRSLIVSPFRGGLDTVDFKRDRVRLVDGTVVPGVLRHDPATGGWRIDSGERSRAVALESVDRVDSFSGGSIPASSPARLVWRNGTTVQGRLAGVSGDSIVLDTAFSGEPVECSREGLEFLTFLSRPSSPPAPPEAHRLYGRDLVLQGRLVPEAGEDPLRWLPEGAVRSQPFPAPLREALQIFLHPGRDADPRREPHRIQLDGGEFLVCRVLSFDPRELVIEAPLSGRRAIPSRHVKAIELDPGPMRLPRFDHPFLGISRDPPRRPPPEDPALEKRIEAALAIPRIKQESPPTHLLVAGNGDVRRGRLLAMDADSLRFRTRLRELTLERKLVRLVVRITAPGNGDPKERSRLILRNGSVFLFEGVASDGENLILQSGIHGRWRIPPDAIRELTLGEFVDELDPDDYSDWVARPAPTRDHRAPAREP